MSAAAGKFSLFYTISWAGKGNNSGFVKLLLTFARTIDPGLRPQGLFPEAPPRPQSGNRQEKLGE